MSNKGKEVQNLGTGQGSEYRSNLIFEYIKERDITHMQTGRAEDAHINVAEDEKDYKRYGSYNVVG